MHVGERFNSISHLVGAVLSVMLWVPSLVLLVFARRLFENRGFAAGFGG